MARALRPDLRNVAIVAHVDHGKTTLVDAMLRQTGSFGSHEHMEERAMDSNDLEREKGITILAKNTAITYKGVHAATCPVTINVIDTPGHADFGGEVERGLSMVDGVVLLVDASEGPLPQTRFVLRKALEAKLPVILLVNKTDRPDARIAEVEEESHDLLLGLASDLVDDVPDLDVDALLDVPVVYASGRAGAASRNRPENGTLPDNDDLEPLFEAILEHVPAPAYDDEAPLQAWVTNLDSSPFLGRLALLRVFNGTLKKGQTVAWVRHDGTVSSARITELLKTRALERYPAESAGPGDIVAIAGFPDITIGETIADPDDVRPLPQIHVDDPAISMTIGTNTSPARRQGQGPQAHRAHGQGPPRPRARRQRLAQGRRHRTPRCVGGAGPRRARPRDPRREHAPRGLRAHRRQAAGGHEEGRRQDCTSRSSTSRSTRPRSTSARSPSCSRPARAAWRA